MALSGHIVWIDVAFQHDFRAGRHLQVMAHAFHHFGFCAAQQAGELVFGQGIRHRCHRAQNRRGVGAQRNRDRERLALCCRRMIAKI